MADRTRIRAQRECQRHNNNRFSARLRGDGRKQWREAGYITGLIGMPCFETPAHLQQ